MYPRISEEYHKFIQDNKIFENLLSKAKEKYPKQKIEPISSDRDLKECLCLQKNAELLLFSLYFSVDNLADIVTLYFNEIIN